MKIIFNTKSNLNYNHKMSNTNVHLGTNTNRVMSEHLNRLGTIASCDIISFGHGSPDKTQTEPDKSNEQPIRAIKGSSQPNKSLLKHKLLQKNTEDKKSPADWKKEIREEKLRKGEIVIQRNVRLTKAANGGVVVTPTGSGKIQRRHSSEKKHHSQAMKVQGGGMVASTTGSAKMQGTPDSKKKCHSNAIQTQEYKKR